jgi:hypothetical protein
MISSKGTRRTRSGSWIPIFGADATKGRVTMLSSQVSNSAQQTGEGGNPLYALFYHNIVIDRKLKVAH